MSPMTLLVTMILASALAAAPAATPENLALRATATASSESGAARFACDGHIPRALKQTDSGLAWAAHGNRHPDGVTFTLTWPEEVTIAELVYYGRTAWCNENWKDYEVRVGTEPTPVLKGVLRAGHGPQRMRLPQPVRTASVTIAFLSHYGGPNPGASEIQAYAESPPDELLGEFVEFDKIVPYRNLVRFKLLEPADTTFYVNLGGYIHNPPWYIPRAVWPENADKDPARRTAAGEFTPWFDLSQHAGHLIHRRMNRSGGVAEFPNVTVDFVASAAHDSRKIVIQLGEQPEGQPDATRVVKEFEESFKGSLTSFLVSPNLEEDKDSLESASQMTERRLAWARAASGGRRVSPTNLIVQTSLYMPQRPELDVKEVEVLWLLGFNVVGGMRPEMRAAYPALRVPGHTHQVAFGPAATEEAIDALMKGHAERQADVIEPGVPFGFSDEICARPPIGDNAAARAHFHAWLAARRIRPKDLGVARLEDVAPIETPDALRAAEQTNAPAARRVFYYTSRFRQEAGTERIKWHSEAFRRHFPAGPLTSTLVADHPYFGGTGMGMGLKTSNFTWGGYPLALDWFDLARNRAVDLAGIEDWMGLQYMFGPRATWEGFQLMGFQAAIFRGGSRGELPVIAWITPSDETNLRLKCGSALAQGAKHFFFWTYGPTATSTENYWSDLRGMHDGIAHISRQLAAAEPVLATGRPRPTRVALLYSISSDLWQPYGYVHMLERRATYLSLVHDQYLVDMLTEEDIEAGRLADYTVLYATDPNITENATEIIAKWVRRGGWLYGACGAGSRNEFDEPVRGLSKVFGIEPGIEVETQDGPYAFRAGLNAMIYMDEISLQQVDGMPASARFGALGAGIRFEPRRGNVVGTFTNGAPAAVVNAYGRGRAFYIGGCPGLSYLRDAQFVADALKEKYPAIQRSAINAWSKASGALPLVELSTPVVEAGVYDSETGSALALANFTYEPIEALAVRLPLPREAQTVRSVENGPLAFVFEDAPPSLRDAGFPKVAVFTMKLGLNDIVLVE
jgi:hypothetical protein